MNDESDILNKLVPIVTVIFLALIIGYFLGYADGEHYGHKAALHKADTYNVSVVYVSDIYDIPNNATCIVLSRSINRDELDRLYGAIYDV